MQKFNKVKINYHLLTHPYSTPAKIPCPEPSTTPTNTVKYYFLGGLAQLVEQRTRRSVKYQD